MSLSLSLSVSFSVSLSIFLSIPISYFGLACCVLQTLHMMASALHTFRTISVQTRLLLIFGNDSSCLKWLNYPAGVGVFVGVYVSGMFRYGASGGTIIQQE